MLSFLKSKGEKLFIACNDGNIKAVASVLKTATAADVNYIDKEGNSPLLLAAYRGHLEIVVALLAHPDVDVTLKDKRGDTALLCAYSKGYLHVMEVLLKHHGVDVNATNKNGDTAFESACKLGRLEELKLLLAHPHVDVNVQIQIERTAIIYASENGHTEVVKLLLTHPKLDVNAQDMNGWTALIFASRGGYAEIVKSILAHPKLDVNTQDEDGWTALMHASENGHPEVVMLLLTHPGIDINLQDKYARTALDLAKTEDIETLIRNHVSSVSVSPVSGIATHSPSIFDNNKEVTTSGTQLLGTKSGENSFDLELAELLWAAAKAGNTLNVIQLLQSATAAEVNYKKEGLAALIYASVNDNVEIVKLLLAHPGVDVNVWDQEGMTALVYAAESGQLEVVKLLLAHQDIDVNAPPYTGVWTALMYATIGGHLEIVKLLLTHSKLDVNAQNSFGLTALIYACDNGHRELVKLLLAHPSVDVNAHAEGGYTALMGAVSIDDLEVVKLLLANPVVDVTLQDKDGRMALDLAKTERTKILLVQHRTAASVDATDEAKEQDTTPTTHPEVHYTNTKQQEQQQHQQKKEQQKEVQQQEGQKKAQQKELTDKDRAALESFLINYTPAVGVALLRAEHLYAMAGQLAAHDRALHVLVNKQKECPSLFWFYPKKRELRNWLSNPLKCLLQDSLMMVVVCPVTLCVVKCGPDGVGWEIRSPKAWVKKWGPAILASIYVMQAAVLAGRIVGIPLPVLPSVGEITNVLGLHVGGGVLKDGMNAVTDQVSAENLMNSLQGFASVTEQCLEEHKREMGGLIHKMQLQQEQQRRQSQSGNGTAPPPHEEITLGADMPTAMIGASYHSIHTFLTTGENAMLGKLEDQLRGSMERVMAEDGEMEWVSVQAVDTWKQMHSTVKVPPIPSPYTAPSSNRAVSIPPTISTVVSSSWLAVRLRAKGTKDESIVLCERILIDEEEYSEEHLLGSTPHTHFTFEYLHSIGITARGLQQKLITIHRELTVEYQDTSPAPVSPFSPQSAASFTSDEKDAVQRELASLKSELSEIKSKSGNNAYPVPNQVGSNSSSGGGGGLKLKQRNEASTINPLTGQEYSMDELILKVAALEANVNSAQHDIGHLGSVVLTHDVDLEDLKGTSSHTKSNPVSSLPSQEHVDQKNDLLRKY